MIFIEMLSLNGQMSIPQTLNRNPTFNIVEINIVNGSNF